MYETVQSPSEELCTLSWVNKKVPDDIHDFAATIIKGTIEHIEPIDSLIKKHSKNWKFERLDIIDKSVLRLSIFCILHLRDIPKIVTINEGVELAKAFGSKTSGQFINGILDVINPGNTEN